MVLDRPPRSLRSRLPLTRGRLCLQRERFILPLVEPVQIIRNWFVDSLRTADSRKNLRWFESFWVRLDVFAFESQEVCQRSLQSALSGRQFQQIVDST